MYPADRELTPTSFESITSGQPVSREPERPSTLRRVGRGCKWIGIVALTTVVAGVIFIHTGWGKELARSRVEAALGKKVNGKVTLGAIDYGFMFSDVELRDLRIADASGAPAIGLDRVAVDLDRGSLIDGAPVLDRVVIRGLDVDIRKNADGTSNLTGLFVPSERKPRHIRVGAIDVAGSSVSITKADGTAYAIDDLTVAGNLDADGVSRVYDVELASVGAAVTISRPGQPDRELALGLSASANIDAADGRQIHAELSDVVAGPLSIARIAAHAGLVDGALSGDQKVEIAGLAIAADQLETMLGRPVLGGDVTGDITLTGPAAALVLAGDIRTSGGRLGVAGSVDASDLEMPGYDLKLTGEDLASARLLPEGRTDKAAPPAIESQLSIAARGTGIPGRPGSLAELAVAIGATSIDLGDRQVTIDELAVKARAEGRAVTLESLIARAPGLSITGSGALDKQRAVDAALAIDIDPSRLVRSLAGLGIKTPPVAGVGPVSLRASARGSLDEAIDLALAPTTVRIAGGRAELAGSGRLERRDGKLAMSRADVSVDLGRVDIQKLGRLAGRSLSVAGSLGGKVAIERRGADRTIRYDVAAELARPAVAVSARGSLSADRATAAIRTKLARIDASLPLTRRGGKRALDLDRSMSVDVEIPATRLSEIAALLPEASAARLRSRARGGAIAARIALDGTARAPRGTIALDADAELVKLAGRKLEIDADIAVSGERGRLTIRPDASISLAGIAGELAVITGAIELGEHVSGGRLDLRSAARAAELALAIDVGERPAASLEALRPKLGRAAGNIAAHIDVTGTPKAPALSGAARWSDYRTAAGLPGAARVAFAGTPAALTATVDVGARDARDRAAIRAEIRRGDRVEVKATARADKIRLAGVVPAIAAIRSLGADLGTLDWNMDADVALSRTDAGLAVSRADVRGHLAVSGGALPVPGSSRRYHGIELQIDAAGDRIELSKLIARERDAARRDRRVSVSGAVELESMKPRAATLTIRAADWLVFGGSMGQSDAPRAELDADIAVAVDMSRPIWAIDANVRSLHLDHPDRFDRAHGLEQISVNRDIMFLDEPGVEIGKLAPVRQVSGTTAAAPAPARRKRRPMDITVRFAKPARITKAPLDVRATGELAISVRPDGVTKRGVLEVVDGELSLFGHPHALERGRLIFDEQHPGGAMDLVFARQLPPAVLRQLSRESGGTAITVTLSGPLSGREVALGGPGAGGFLETLAWENGGRGMYHTAPGLPASASVQAPRNDQPLVMTFIQVNLPHMQMLDRFSAWSDPYRDDGSYGRVEHFDGERYGRESDTRVKVVARPETLGRSQAEVHLDKLWVNRDDLAIGAGVRAGSRAGGGLGVFLEWSSED